MLQPSGEPHVHVAAELQLMTQPPPAHEPIVQVSSELQSIVHSPPGQSVMTSVAPPSVPFEPM